jgi:hypothetical protein
MSNGCCEEDKGGKAQPAVDDTTRFASMRLGTRPIIWSCSFEALQYGAE